MSLELVVKQARLRSGNICDILIKNGKIAQMGNSIHSAEKMIEAGSNLVTEAFVVPHLHLDKVMTGSLAEEAALAEYQGSMMAGAMTAVEMASKVKEHYVESEILERARKVLADATRYGVSHMRAFADVDTKAELVGLRALLRTKKEFRDKIDVEIVAFPQDGIIRDPGAEELLYKAMDLGANVVGGIPWIEYTDEDSKKHVDIAFEIAKKYDADVAMLTDDAGDPELRTTEYLATAAIRNGWTGRVAACHARATALYSEVYHRKLIALLRKAGVSVVTDPHTGPLHVRVKDLLNGGVTVALGQDDIGDAFYPYGRCNMLEVAFLAAHLLWMMSNRDRETLYDMITLNGAKTLRIGDYGLATGKQADLVVLDAQNLRDALAYHNAPLYVIKRGGVIRSTRASTPN